MSSGWTRAAILAALTVGQVAWAQEVKPAAPKPEAKPETAKPTVSGFLQVDYRRGDDAGGSTAVAHELDLRRARVAVRGKLDGRISYTLNLQAEGANVRLLDLAVDYAPRPLFKLRAGQYKYDFDFEGREGGSALAFLDRPFITNAIAGSMDGTSNASTPKAAFRDRGLTLLGDTKDRPVNWGYSLGVFQGAGRASDGNDAFGYAANLRVSPARGLRLNAGLLAADGLTKGAPGKNRYSAWTGGVAYERKRASLRAEYYRGKRDKDTSTQDVQGFYVRAIANPTERLELLARYQQMEDERFPQASRDARSFDLGLRWYLTGKTAQPGAWITANYMARSAEDGFKDGLTLLNDGRGPALSAGDLVKGVFAVRLQVQF